MNIQPALRKRRLLDRNVFKEKGRLSEMGVYLKIPISEGRLLDRRLFRFFIFSREPGTSVVPSPL